MSEYLTKYFNAATFNDATTVYDNATLTSVSVNGYYSDGVVTRYQTSGVLGPNLTCPSCPSFSCTSGIDIPLGTQVARFDLQTQFNTEGAIKITVKRIDLAPVGIQLQINNSPADVKFSANVGNAYDEQGEKSAPIPNQLSMFATNNPSHPLCNAYNFDSINVATYTYNGIDWGTIGALSSVSISNKSNTIRTDALTPVDLVMYVPKISASPITNLRIIGVSICDSTIESKIEIDCPVVLEDVPISSVETSTGSACSNNVYDEPCYVGYVSGSTVSGDVRINVNDFLFRDENGLTKVSDGYYGLSKANTFGGITNPSFPYAFIKVEDGIVVQTGTCT